MTSSPPPDAPVYRGKTLTPESPRPVHVPEPTNIPVLENQIDPVFNLMSTHLSSAPPPHIAPTMDELAAQPGQPAAEPAIADAEAHVGQGNEGDQSTLEQGGMDMVGTASATASTFAPHEQSESLPRGPVSDAPSAPIDAASLSAPFMGAPTALPAHEAHEIALPASSAEATLATASQSKTGENNSVAEGAPATHVDGPVNYQALIDNIIPSNPTDEPHGGDGLAVSAPTEGADIASASATLLLSPGLNASSAGLPPRPPPQEKPAIHPNYNPEEDIRTYHYPNLASAPATLSPNGAFNSVQPFQTAGPAPGTTSLPAMPTSVDPYPAFNRSNDAQNRDSHQSQRQRQSEAARRQNAGDRDDNAPWGPDIQKVYDKFLEDETVYTAEGTWDRFPKDSRLFVGNLPTDVVTKRDIFHIFYRYGRLAQISIKNAYGFVQFMDEAACRNAMHSEQGKKIKEKSMHLEISKPPKNSRNAAVSAAGERLRASHYRRSRSRSPDHDRRPGSRGDRHNRSGDYRDAFRRGRDDYRPGRSPSPHGRGGRDSYRGRDRSPDRYGGRRDRSRSPYGRYRRSPTPPRRMYDDDDVPLPRRSPRDVPEVQIILVDQLDRGFVDFVQNAFRSRSLSVAVLAMPGLVSLDAVVKRQIVEGVMAVVKLFRAGQATAKIPVQIFDRTGGMNQVRFEEYEGLEPHVAAELVIRSKQKQATAALNAQPPYGAALQQLGINLPPQPQHAPQQPGAVAPNLANLITQLDGPALQKLLGAMQTGPNTPQSALAPPQPSPTQSLGFGNMMAAGPPSHGGSGPPAYGYPPPQHVPGPYPGPQQQQPPPHQPPPTQPGAPYGYPQNGPPKNQVQDIMSQLAQWRR